MPTDRELLDKAFQLIATGLMENKDDATLVGWIEEQGKAGKPLVDSQRIWLTKVIERKGRKFDSERDKVPQPTGKAS